MMIYRKLNASFTLQELAKKTSGKLHGDSELRIDGLAPLEEAADNALAYIAERNSQTIAQVKGSGEKASFLVTAEFPISDFPNRHFIEVPNPQRSFIALVDEFYERWRPEPGINKLSEIDDSARLGEGCTVSAFCTIMEDVQIGENVVIYPNVTIYPRASIGDNSVIHSGAVIREDVEIGKQCIVHAGARIGNDGFGYIPDPEHGLKAVPQIGRVILGDYVEVGANTCIDRGAAGDTEIGQGTKIDNLAQLGHNVKVGQYTVICGTSAIGGSVKIGNQVVIGGAVGIADHLRIVDGARVGGRSGVTGHLKEKGDYLGYPAIKAYDWRRQQVALRKLPDLLRKLKK